MQLMQRIRDQVGRFFSERQRQTLEQQAPNGQIRPGNDPDATVAQRQAQAREAQRQAEQRARQAQEEAQRRAQGREGF